MKTVLAATAVLAFSIAPALAECAGHVSADVGKPMTLASAETEVTKPSMSEPATDETTTGAIEQDKAD